jgi:hypothetical protein
MLPVTLITVWLLCISIPAITGPIADPIYLNSVFMPSDVPIDRGETEREFTLSCPTFRRDIPIPIIARAVTKCITLVPKTNIRKKPQVITNAPMIVTLGEPNFEIIKPDVGPKISDVIENGSCIFAAVTALPPNPPA